MAIAWKGWQPAWPWQKRWGKPAEELPPDHPAWALEAEYLAAGLVNLILAYSPERIILGGGVMQQPQLVPAHPGEGAARNWPGMWHHR